MKLCAIIVLYKTPQKEVTRLRKELLTLKIDKDYIYFIDNTNKNKGYAAGVNQGLRKAIDNGCDMFLVLNPDVSLTSLKGQDIFAAAAKFDIWGFAMKQDGVTYYGGNLDLWRMSADLIMRKPRARFSPCKYITGSLMIIKKQVIQSMGFFDETYGMYYEDVDYCVRAGRAGFRIGIDSALQYTHFEWSRKNKLKKAYLKRNRAKLFWKYGSVKQKAYEIARLPKTVTENSPFLMNFFSFNVFSFIAKILGFILFLFLIRYLSVEKYGAYTLVWAYIGLFGAFADMGTTTYGIVNLKNKKNNYISNLFSLRLVLSFMALLLSLLLSPIFRHTGQTLLYIFLISPVFLSNMVSGTLLIVYSLKERVYKSSLISLLFNTTFTVCLIAIASYFKELAPIFVTIALLNLTYALITFFFLNHEVKGIKFSYIRKDWMKIIAQSMVYVMISFFAGLYFMSDVFLLNYFKGSGAVGIYSAGYKFFQAFLFVVTSYNVTAMPLLAKAFSSRNNFFYSRLKKDLLFLLFVGLSIALLFYFAAPYLLPFVLKGNYLSSIRVSQIVIFALPLMLASSVFLNCLYIAKKPHIVLGLFFLQFCLNFFLNYLLIPRYSYFASAYLTVFSEGVNVGIAFLLLRWVIKNNKNKKLLQ